MSSVIVKPNMKVPHAVLAFALVTLAGILPACTSSRTQAAGLYEDRVNADANEGYATTPVHVGMSRAEVNAALGTTKPVFNTPSGRINFEAVETSDGRVLILPYVYKNRTAPSPEDVIEHPPSYMTVLGE